MVDLSRVMVGNENASAILSHLIGYSVLGGHSEVKYMFGGDKGVASGHISAFFSSDYTHSNGV